MNQVSGLLNSIVTPLDGGRHDLLELLELCVIDA